jgi:hypothetical protein
MSDDTAVLVTTSIPWASASMARATNNAIAMASAMPMPPAT